MNADTVHLNNTLKRAREFTHAHEGALQEAYAKLLRAAGRASANQFRQQARVLVAATNPWQPPANDLVDGEALEQDALATVIPIHRRALNVPEKVYADIGISFDVGHATSQALLDSISSRLSTLGDAIRQQVNETIQLGYSSGWSVSKTADAIVAKVDDVTPGRAQALARTDLNAISNGASVAMAREVGVDTKTWLATEDERTRETHADADGQTVPVDQPFTVGGEQCDYPGDPDLSDEESFNCRCTVIYGEPLTAAATAEGGDMDETLTAAASGDTGLPLSDRDHAWDAGQATGRLKKWASSDGSGDPDTVDYSKLARGYFWRDKAGADGPALGDLKFPFADIVGGKLTAVWRGVTAGAQRLASAKDVDVAAIQKRMDPYYAKAKAQFDDPTIKPPWEQGDNQADLDTMTSDQLVALHAKTGRILSLRAMVKLEEFTIVQAAAPGEPTRWVAPAICVEGQPTEDGRVLLPGSVTWRDGVLPLGIMLDTPHGDLSTAPLCGGIDTFQRIGGVIAAGGYFNDNLDPDEAPDMVANARQAIAAIQSKTATGISVDLMVIDGGLIYESALDPAGEDELPPEVGEDMGYPEPAPIATSEEQVEEEMAEDTDRLLMAVFEGVIGGACICPIPAIANASIAVVASGYFERLVVTTPLFADCGCDTQPVPVSLVAAVAPLEPPAEWFDTPEGDGPMPLTVDDTGRVYGHVALWNTCHEGFPGRCVTPPRSHSGYRKFHNGELRLADGSRVAVGKLTLAAGHAGTRGVSEAQARAHYDNTATVGAFVRANDGRHGIWVCGALKSNLSPEHVRDLMTNPLSGDWRNGEMIAAHAVVDPGFPILRASGLGELFDVEDEAEVESANPLLYLRPGARSRAVV